MHRYLQTIDTIANIAPNDLTYFLNIKKWNFNISETELAQTPEITFIIWRFNNILVF